MTCREFADFILEYRSGGLDAGVRAAFEGHLERCTNCRRYLASYEHTVTLAQHAYDDDAAVPDDVPEDLVQAILTARRR